MSEEVFKKVVSHAKEYGFVFPSSEIYDGLGAVYDYGQNGVELKNNLRQYWWKAMVQMHENIVGLDAAIFMHPKTWKASGHIDGFSDPMIDNKDSKKRYRADNLLEDKISRYEKDGKTIKATELQAALDQALLDNDLVQLKTLIEQHEIACPISGTRNWTDVRQFNLMFSTEMGAMAEDADKIYLRPETAQGIFVNFLNVQKSGRMKIPFGIAQTGKAFRNEIIARQFIMRMREFEQMEMQFFIRPGTQKVWYEHWKAARMAWHEKLGFGSDKYRFHDHVKLAHYADAAVDIEFDFPFGFKEMEGIHSRTDFDLRNHQELSGKKLQYFDADLDENGKAYGNYIPYVIETSIGLDRLFLATMCASYKEEIVGEGEKQDTRVVLNLPPILAPYKVAILPLMKKDGLPEVAREIMKDLKTDYNCFYEEKDAIGKRYRRQDALGTPFCVTIDHQTLEDQTITIRYRDTMLQERIAISELRQILAKEINWAKLLA
ncbi:MAG: glycine--tRNA ligase [Bacteroidetes bacterium B1(2017)]|nr:MAG: glycine--tRNA ligase [Bacteroidetes bacterium B1(2017)]